MNKSTRSPRQLTMTNPSETLKIARKSFLEGLTKPVKFRQNQLKNFLDFLRENEERIIDALFEDLRKPREEARLEIIVGINHLRYLLFHLNAWTRPEYPEKRIIECLDTVCVYNDPYGVVLVMSDWNFPLLTILPMAGAIAAGNCVVIKPSHLSPSFGEMLSKFLPNYLDCRCYPVFLGGIPETTLLLEQRFDYIYYTGSVNVGRIVHKAANQFLTPTTLELGGKNPVYIDESADIEMTATRIMWSKYFNSGQTCIAPEYILCSKKVEEQFIKFSLKALQKFGEDWRKRPIINDNHFKRLQFLLEGLKIAIGGGSDPLNNTMEITVPVDVDPNHRIMLEEIFGPILPIINVTTFTEAVNFINKREKPLALYVFTKQKSTVSYFLENTSSGGVTVNDVMMHLVVESLPFGGVGSSGMGAYKGKKSFDTFVHKKSVLVKNFSTVIEKIQEIRYPPYSKLKTDFLAALVKSRRGVDWKWVVYTFIFIVGFLCAFIIFYLLL